MARLRQLTAKEVRAFRVKLGYSQEQFAQAVGVTVSTVNRWENGKSHMSPMATARVYALATQGV